MAESLGEAVASFQRVRGVAAKIVSDLDHSGLSSLEDAAALIVALCGSAIALEMPVDHLVASVRQMYGMLARAGEEPS